MTNKFHVVVVGAGFAGLYLLYRLRQAGLTAVALEQGDNVGGTWYWNRYPGARCDAESLAYSFSFSESLDQSWNWSERYAAQPEILRYAEHVADHFDLRRDIRFNERVNGVHLIEQRTGADALWRVTTESGLQVQGDFCVLATGCLSVPQLPAIDGIDNFAGDVFQASRWPKDGVDFSGRRVGLIGTGSSGIQAVPVMAQEADHLQVFQRTPNFSVPAANGPLDPDWVKQFKRHYPAHRHFHKHGLSSGFGDLEIVPKARMPAADTAAELDAQTVSAVLEPYWQRGGASFLSAFADSLLDANSNAAVADFVRNKIRSIVKDPKTAELLCPSDHPIGSKRICVDTGYYETFNLPHVDLVDVKNYPIEHITPDGLKTANGEYHFDTLVLATGFDAMTGALLRMDVRGEEGLPLKEVWQEGPQSYLGLMVSGFPNLFTVTGPGSPSVLSNMLVSIEQHVDWIVSCFEYMQTHEHQRIEADEQAQAGWMSHVGDVANATLFPQGGSWYLGANVAGKPQVFMPYAGGVGMYREICDGVVEDGYRGFRFS